MAISKPILDKITDELLRMDEDCAHSSKSQFNACDRWTWWNYAFGVPSVMLSAAAGAAFFKDYATFAGIMSCFVTILTALMSFLNPAERAAHHKSAGGQYLALRNDARVYRELGLTQIDDDAAAIAEMEGFLTRRNELNLSSPQPYITDFKQAKKGIDAGQSFHAVDKRK